MVKKSKRYRLEYRARYQLFSPATMLLAAVLSSGAGCDLHSSDTGELPAEKAPPRCPPWNCGGNSPIVNDTIVGEINLDGEAGTGGFEFLYFLDALSLPLSLDVDGGEFVATGLFGTEYRGEELENGLIVLKDLSDLSLHVIRIADFNYVDSFTTPGHSVPAYHLQSATFKPLTGPGTYSETCGVSDWLPGIGLAFNDHYAVLVADERYDPVAKEVSVSGASADRWFNIACNGSALAKMKLLGYDPEHTDTSTTFESTVAQRQATLKMITADYCGTGMAFTVEGQPLIANNADGTATLASSGAIVDTSEAIWTEDGALCLDVPRRAGAEPTIDAKIAAECGGALPSCSSSLPDWESHGEWRTHNPAP